MTEFCPALFAYIDPATGSLVVQAVIAALLSAGIVFRRMLFNPIALLAGGRRNASSRPADQWEDEPQESAN